MPEHSTTDAVQRATLLSRIVFGTAALALVFLSFGLIIMAIGVVVAALTSAAPVDRALLDAVGYMVIGIAVFDVAKYLLEEEVVRTRELRSAAEARRSLTKFLSTIAIAVFLEALVGVFETAKDDIRLMLYPTLLLIAGVFMILGLGLYIRFSAQAEMQVGMQDERADAQRVAADHGERLRPPAG